MLVDVGCDLLIGSLPAENNQFIKCFIRYLIILNDLIRFTIMIVISFLLLKILIVGVLIAGTHLGIRPSTQVAQVSCVRV